MSDRHVDTINEKGPLMDEQQEQEAYDSTMPLTQLRPRLTQRLLDAITLQQILVIVKRDGFTDTCRTVPVTTVGLLLRYAREHGDWWMRRIPRITKAEQNRLAEALENFWCDRTGV